MDIFKIFYSQDQVFVEFVSWTFVLYIDKCFIIHWVKKVATKIVQLSSLKNKWLCTFLYKF